MSAASSQQLPDLILNYFVIFIVLAKYRHFIMKILSFLLLLCALNVSNAQTLTQTYHEPVVGDVDKNYRLDTSAYTSGLPTGVTGNNVTWDFTKLTGIFPMII